LVIHPNTRTVDVNPADAMSPIRLLPLSRRVVLLARAKVGRMSSTRIRRARRIAPGSLARRQRDRLANGAREARPRSLKRTKTRDGLGQGKNRVLVQAAINGTRTRAEHPAIPITPAQQAKEAAAAVTEGAGAVHVHVRGSNRQESLAPQDVASALEAIRAACP
jgi:hypothetical protein